MQYCGNNTLSKIRQYPISLSKYQQNPFGYYIKNHPEEWYCIKKIYTPAVSTTWNAKQENLGYSWILPLKKGYTKFHYKKLNLNLNQGFKLGIAR